MAKLRIERVETGHRLPVERATTEGATVDIGVSAPTSENEVVPAAPGLHAFKAIGGDCYVSIGTAPNPSQEPRMYLGTGDLRWRHVGENQRISWIEGGEGG